MVKPRRILITSAGSGVGQALVKAAHFSPHSYQFIGTNTLPLPDSSFSPLVLSPWTHQQEAFKTFLLTLIQKEKPDLVFAGRDEELPILAELKPLVSKNTQITCGSTDSSRFARDKYASYAMLHRMGLPFTPTALSNEWKTFSNQNPPPYLIKPRHGFASRGIHLAHNADELKKHLESSTTEMIIQSYLYPIEWQAKNQNPTPYNPDQSLRQEFEYSGQILLDPQGEYIDSYASCNHLKNGRDHHIHPLEKKHPFSQKLKTWAHGLKQSGLRGPVNIGAKQTAEQHFTIFEINARCTGVTGMRAAQGFNELDLLYQHFVKS